ncbi:hypothetical protein PROFUN_06609 [Planoprotostelium fungivorum]|uniref:Uncharacterized protein n=1 Tax=Planoprotostelium fungivorum TaxID=1890364 RepID=A0A2P6MS06_9EUKA|nr:hypothetical protein PROFUN_06609 [Planoprotostelium fungivorum]
MKDICPKVEDHEGIFHVGVSVGRQADLGLVKETHTSMPLTAYRLTGPTVDAILYIVESILGPSRKACSVDPELKALVDAVNHRCIFVDNPQFNAEPDNTMKEGNRGKSLNSAEKIYSVIRSWRATPFDTEEAWKASIAYETKIREAEERLKAETDQKMRKSIEEEVMKQELYDNKTKEFMRAHSAVEKRSVRNCCPAVGAGYCYGLEGLKTVGPWIAQAMTPLLKKQED